MAQNHVLSECFDRVLQALRVEGTGTNGAITVEGISESFDSANNAIRTEGISFEIDPTAKFFTVELANAGLRVIYKFRTGSIAGPVVSTITLNYATVQNLILTDGALT